MNERNRVSAHKLVISYSLLHTYVHTYKHTYIQYVQNALVVS